MVTDKIQYGKKELLGTLIRILKWRLADKPTREKLLQQANKYDTSNVYCIAFVADCMEASGKTFIDVEHSISVVDEGWYDCHIPCNNEIMKIK